MSLTARALQVSSLVCLICHFCTISAAATAERCANPAGRLVSVQGEVSVQAAGASSWIAAGLDLRLCPGDTLRVGENGRAAVVLANESVLRVGQNSALSFAEPTTGKVSLLKLLQGILHIFSHRPHSLNIATPFVSGGVEGTEFLVRVMPDHAVITVFEGRVMAANGQGQLAVTSGQSIIAAAGQAPRYETVVRPRDAVQWTLYYPPISDRTGDAAGKGSSPLSAAVDALAVGRTDEARQLIAGVLDKDSGNAEALALLAIIELVQNNSDEARRLAEQASSAAPTSVAAAMSMAYVQQATFDIPGALATLEQARQANPDSAELLARLAELQLSVGELDRAEASAMQAAALNPDIGRIQAVLGFAHLTRIQTEQAKEAFARAIALDPAMPLARLGLGLALIREGELEDGRAEIEIAAALDPGSALIRSYLGKAYYEEKRDGGAARQYEIARELDPADPTPWFYDALRKQSINRPVEALHDLQKSIELNDNRAVYRSRLLLDEDLAVRGASLGRIYGDLGFQQLALVEGWKSVNADPANYSAHRFLADSYSALPRHEIARVSELLQSQLLQPLNITPVQPQLAESNLFILDGAGPAEASLNEYSPLFLRNRLALQASGVAGSNDTFGDEVVQSGVWNRFSYSLGQFHYQTDGFRENNDQDQDIVHAMTQLNLSPSTSLLWEFRDKDRETGDLTLLFDPSQFSEKQRQDNWTRTNRLGFQQSISSSMEIVGTAVVEDLEETTDLEFDENLFFKSLEEHDGIHSELQVYYRSSGLNLTSGLGYYDSDWQGKYEFLTDPSAPWTDPVESDVDVSQTNAHLYAYLPTIKNVDLTLAINYNDLDKGELDEDQFNPKFGLSWRLLPTTSLRAAVFRTMSRILVADQTIEPTVIAGFNQFYDDVPGTDSWVSGIGVDQLFGEKVFGGIEYVGRDQQIPYEFFSASDFHAPSYQMADWREDSGRAYLYWAPLKTFVLSAEYFYELYNHDNEFIGMEGIEELRTQKLRFGGRFFYSCGMSLKIQASYVDQAGDFVNAMTSQTTSDGDQFWVIDAGIGYRLPKRYGFLSLETRNLFDESFQFQDTDPAHPTISPNQLILLKLSIVL